MTKVKAVEGYPYFGTNVLYTARKNIMPLKEEDFFMTFIKTHPKVELRYATSPWFIISFAKIISP